MTLCEIYFLCASKGFVFIIMKTIQHIVISFFLNNNNNKSFLVYFPHLLMPRTYDCYSLQLNSDGEMVALPFNFAILEWAAGTSKVMSDAVLQFKNY